MAGHEARSIGRRFWLPGAHKLYVVGHMAGSDAGSIGRKFWWPGAHKLYSVSARICRPYGRS